MRRLRGSIAALATLAIVFGCSERGSNSPGTKEEWLSYGGSWDEAHYSRLDQVNEQNVKDLGLAWRYDLPTMISSVGAPLVVGDTLFVGLGLSQIYAFDATSGQLKWEFDPQTAKAAGPKLQLGWGIRGIAYGDGKIVTGTADGRLIAINKDTGKPVWSVETTEPGDLRYITGAPRIFDCKVIIGHGGADFSPTRGYVSTYDLATGKQIWRFYTVPGDPAKGFENEAMQMASKTWTGEWWKQGGGGTVWDNITYDQELDRIYIGTGNGAPWNQKIRSPEGGDNLFLASIVALDAKSGRYIWHYQVNPGETWDWTATANMIAATIEIKGKKQKVLMQAPKNGVFYVLNRETGKLISAEPFGKINWLKKVDLKTGRPIEEAFARPENGVADLWPGTMGAHNWQPMGFSPKTGLVYIPTSYLPGHYDFRAPEEFSRARDGSIIPRFDQTVQIAVDATFPPAPESLGALQAWDPVAQKAVWSQPLRGAVNGGVAVTEGGLVFQGLADGRFTARSASTGKLLWSFDVQNGVLGQPAVYSVKGKQYIAVVTGFGGTGGVLANFSSQFNWHYRTQNRRVLVFALHGKEKLPDFIAEKPVSPLIDGSLIIDTRKAKSGFPIYAGRCLMCHGINAIAGGSAPDLRASSIVVDARSFDTVMDGALVEVGMPRFGDISPQDREALRHYIRRQAMVSPRARESN